MKPKFNFLLLCLCICSSLFAKTRETKRIEIFALDGISVEGFKTAQIPNLNALLNEGALSLTTRVVMPSITLPNWTSHLTGSGPEQHGVTRNGWTMKNFKLPPIETDADGYYPSVFQVLKENNPKCRIAFYYNWKELINPFNKKYLDESCFLEDDLYIENFQKAFDFIIKNKNKSALIFLYSGHTDHTGHTYGWMSPEYIRSIEEADIQIGEFIKKLKQEKLYKDTYFMFLTDHGGINKGHGKISVDEMIVPWGISGPGIKRMNLTEPNNTVNTAATILYLFNIKQPSAWTSEVPMSIFDK